MSIYRESEETLLCLEKVEQYYFQCIDSGTFQEKTDSYLLQSKKLQLWEEGDKNKRQLTF